MAQIELWVALQNINNQGDRINMAVLKLTQHMINLGLQCPADKTKFEAADMDCRGLYALVTSTSQAWFYRYKKDGKTCHIRIGKVSEISLAAARNSVAQLRGQIAAGSNPKGEAKPKETDQNLHDFFYTKFVPFIKTRLRSWHRSEELYRLRIDSVFGQKKLTEIKRHDVITFLSSLLDSGLAPASVNHHAKVFRRALNLAVDWEMLEKNPLSRIPMYAENNKLERYMNDKQLQALLQVLQNDSNRTVCLAALWLLSTGARCGEALKATWSQIDRTNNVWRVPASNTKANKVRSIPLNDSALQVLKQLTSEGRYENLFVNEKTGLPYVTIVKSWSRLRIKAGMPQLRVHDLRHQYASFLVNAGRTLFEVQSILGHSDPSVTQRYSHLSTKSLSEAANAASVMIMRGMQVPVTEAVDTVEAVEVAEPLAA